MNIEYKDYLLKQSIGSDGFDLVRKVVRNKKDKATGENTGETYEAETVIGYDMTIEKCCKSIIMEELKQRQETVDFDRFLTEYTKQKEELLNTIKLD